MDYYSSLIVHKIQFTNVNVKRLSSQVLKLELRCFLIYLTIKLLKIIFLYGRSMYVLPSFVPFQT